MESDQELEDLDAVMTLLSNAGEDSKELIDVLYEEVRRSRIMIGCVEKIKAGEWAAAAFNQGKIELYQMKGEGGLN